MWDFVGAMVMNVLVTPVRSGTLALRTHPASIVGITWVVTAIVGILIVTIMAANPLREMSDFIAVVDSAGNSVVPAFLVPAMLLLLALSSALVLAGSQRLRLSLRIAILVAVTAILANLIASSMTVNSEGSGAWIPWVALATIAGYSFAIWTQRTNAAIDFLVLLVLALIVAVSAYRGFIAGTEVIETRFDLITTSTLLVTLTSLALPIAFTSGLSATQLGVSIATQATEFVSRRVSARVASLILVVAIVWQVMAITPGLMQRWGELGLARSLGAVMGALLVIGLAVLCWRFAHRAGGVSTEPDAATIAVAVAVPIAYTIMAPVLISNVLALIGATVALGRSAEMQSTVVVLVEATGSDTAIVLARMAVVVGLCVTALITRRRGQVRLTAVLLIDALMITLIVFLRGPMLALGLDWSVAELGNIGLLIGIVTLMVWGARRALSPHRLTILFTIVLLSALLRQADYFAVPVGFLIGASAMALLIVGLVWGFLTDGGATHEDTARSPRDGKLLLFLGTFLFGIAIVAWAAIGKQVYLAAQLSSTTAFAVATIGSAYVLITILDVVLPAPRRD